MRLLTRFLVIALLLAPHGVRASFGPAPAPKKKAAPPVTSPTPFSARTADPIGDVLDDCRDVGEAGLGGLIRTLDGLGGRRELAQALTQLSPEQLVAAAPAILDTTRLFQDRLFRLGAPGPQAQARHTSLVRALASLQRGAVERDPIHLDYPPLDSSHIDPLRNDDVAAIDVAAAPWGRWNAFLESFGGYGTLDARDDRVGQRSWTAGAMSGADYRIGENSVAGLSALYGYTDTSARVAHSKGRTHSVRLGPYASTRRGAWHFGGGVSGAYHWIENERDIRFSGFSRTADSDHGAWDVAAHTAARLEIDWGEIRFAPTTSLHYIHLEEDGFHERGAGAANLRIGDGETDSLRSRVGMQMAYEVPTEGGGLLLDAEAGWSHEYLDHPADLDARFASASHSDFRVRSAGLDDDALYYGVGTRFELSETASVQAYVTGERSSHATQHFATLRFEMRF